MRIFVECTHTYERFFQNTGIQRVVRNVINNLKLINIEPVCEIFPVVYENSEWHVVESIRSPFSMTDTEKKKINRRAGVRAYVGGIWFALRTLFAALLPFNSTRKFFLGSSLDRNSLNFFVAQLLSFKNVFVGNKLTVECHREIDLGKDDILILLDASWHRSDIFQSATEAKKNGCIVVVAIYDLIPIQYPQYCTRELTGVFRNWVYQAFDSADAFICISRSVQSDVEKKLNELKIKCPVDCFYLGSELDAVKENESVREHVTKIISKQDPIFLVVGTLEPRKRCDVIFQAFENAWRNGLVADLVFIGKVGWKVEQLIERMKQSPYFGNRLHVLNDINDTELNAFYDRANALVFASDAEGFGLPIVEAGQRGLPVIASDIPVFREIASKNTVFFQAGDAQSLADVIRDFIQRKDVSRTIIPWMTWRDSSEMLIKKVIQLSERV